MYFLGIFEDVGNGVQFVLMVQWFSGSTGSQLVYEYSLVASGSTGSFGLPVVQWFTTGSRGSPVVQLVHVVQRVDVVRANLM